MEAQLQARRRAEESRDAIRDITEWIAKQNATDRALIQEKETASRYAMLAWPKNDIKRLVRMQQ